MQAMIRKLIPSLRERVWGRTELAPWFPNQRTRVGEAWFEASSELGSGFPLVKLLFTSEKLSVQVHPNDEYAKLRHSCNGKTEMWHILAAEPGAQIAAGFREPVSPERLRESALSGEIERLLGWHDAAAGDTFFIPAGTVHAIGAGLVLLEVQQNSDVTYRLYDYGRARELHLDDGAKVSRGDRHEARVNPAGDVLVECEYFRVRRWQVAPGARREFAKPEMLMVLEGSGSIDGLPTNPGEAWIVEGRVEINGPMRVARISSATDLP